MERFICVHGHFYQPPRENPWIEAVETQDSAYPYHDWNERITAECYGPNALSRILDGGNRITHIVSNYARMSYNIGPTLMSWLEKNSPKIYRHIIESDQESMLLRGGHGSAMAQAFNHMIMPLANSRDKRTQVLWGARDFEYRYERKPEGMWLPETAVDLETLECLASSGIRFTLLAPHQAKRFRKKGDSAWADASGGSIDPSRAYALKLPSGKSIDIFFYDAPISHAVAFEKLLNSGEGFANRIIGGFSDRRKWSQLVHIATDGESYGHHHKFGDMGLAYALNHIEGAKLARITNYGEFLEMFPPEHEVELFEDSSWSCAHGVERWRSDCGCNSGGHAGWNQAWRGPLRKALDWLRDELAALYETEAAKYLRNPWEARNGYIDVILDRSPETTAKFFDRYGKMAHGAKERSIALKLLEMQRHAMLMYTSCGWFFDEISGIETVQIIQYAGRAIQLAAEVGGTAALEKGFIKRLEAAKSNLAEYENGAAIYNKQIKPFIVGLDKVCAHYAISSLFEEYPQELSIYSYDIVAGDYRRHRAGKFELVAGNCTVSSNVTGEEARFMFGILHLGNHDFNCGVRKYPGDKAFREMKDALEAEFEQGAFAECVRLLDKHFANSKYTIKDLFRDEQRKILDILMAETTDDFGPSYRRMYEENRILMGFLKDSGMRVPKPFITAADYTLHMDIKHLFTGQVEPERVEFILGEFRRWNIEPESIELEFTIRHMLEDKFHRLAEKPENLRLLRDIDHSIDVILKLPFATNLWEAQNIYHSLARAVYPLFVQKTKNDPKAAEWVTRFKAIGEKLNFNLSSLLPSTGKK